MRTAQKLLMQYENCTLGDGPEGCVACTGMHMGKVLVQVEDAEGALTHSGPPAPVAAGSPPAPAEPIMAPPVQARTVFAARPDRSYLLIGGLGGLGLALATWLAQRGAKHLILSSKRCFTKHISA